jgi:hypothetical protein
VYIQRNVDGPSTIADMNTVEEDKKHIYVCVCVCVCVGKGVQFSTLSVMLARFHLP